MTRRRWLALAATAALAAERRNRAPISHDPLTMKLPQADSIKLSNGLTILALEDNRFPVAFVRVQVEGAGSVYTPHAGLAELTAEMLREGAAGRSGKQIDEEAARLGATLASSATTETSTVDALGLAGHFSEWFALLGGVVMRPAFSADDFNALRQRWLARLRMRRSGVTLADDALHRLIYGPHPAALLAPSQEALATLTPEMLAAWHRERYTPGNLVISCIGRVRPATVAAQSEKVFGSWKGADVIPQLPPSPARASVRRFELIDQPGAAQTELAIGGLLFERRDPDYIPCTVLNRVLGGTISARLSRILREEKGYAYAAYSGFGAYHYPGFWRANAGVRTDATGESLAIMLDQLRRLCEEPVPAAELEEAKIGVTGAFALTLEQPQQVITQSYLRHRYGFSMDYLDRYPARIAAVTADEVRSVAQKYLDPARAQIAAAGDASRIRAPLSKILSIS